MLEIVTHREWHPEVQFWAALIVGAALLVLAAVSLATRRRPAELLSTRILWSARGVLLLFVVTTGVSYFYGSRNNGSWTHRWDLFHTAMSTRYFEELGYFRLYECSYVLGREEGLLRGLDRIRDPRTQERRDAASFLQTSDCHERFSPERRESFIDDLRLFLDAGLSHRLFTDKGYNGTPAYSMIAGAFLGGELSMDKLGRLGLIDVALVLLALLFLWRAFGIDIALLAAIFFFVNFPGRFVHMGGSILRFDYVACVLAALGCLRLGRHGWAGGLVAYATMMRAFPVFFAVGYGVHALWDVFRKRRIERRHVAFFGAFAGVCAALVVSSGLVYDGLETWRRWYENLRVHTDGTAAFRVGFRHFFMIEPPWATDAFSFSDPTAEVYAGYRWAHLASAALLLAPVMWAARRSSAVTTTGLFGLFAFYLLMVATRYYYAIFAVILLLDLDLARRRLDLLLVSGAFFVMALVNRYFESDEGWPHIEFSYNFLFSGLAGLVLIAFVGRMLWNTRRPQRDEGAPRASF